MAFKTVIEKLEDVEEPLRQHYVENKDPKTGAVNYVIGLDGGIDILPQAKALRTENGGYRIKLKDFETRYDKLKAFEGMDPADVLAKLDRIAELEAANGGKLDEKKIDEIVEGRVKGKIAPLQRQHDTLKTETENLRKENEGLKKEKTSRTISDAVREAAVKMKMLPEAMEDAIMLAERVMEVDSDGKVVVRDQVGFTPGVDAASWLGDIQAKRPHWWPASSGAGSQGNRNGGGAGGGPNPWTREGWNLTAQGNMLRTDEKQAERLALAAGTTIGGGMPAAKKA